MPKLSLIKDHFKISDNCGGMSKDILENYAFRLGRPRLDSDRDKNLATVGLYGIGMSEQFLRWAARAWLPLETVIKPIK
jgi:hypothetical protein